MSQHRQYHEVVEIDNWEEFRSKLLHWVWQQKYSLFLESHDIIFPHGAFPKVVAAGAREIVQFSGTDDLTQLYEAHQKCGDWLFGHLGYDLKNQFEKLESHLPDRIQFPDIHFFSPDHLFFIYGDQLILESDRPPEEVLAEINAVEKEIDDSGAILQLQAITNRSTYLKDVNEIKNHILNGDIYEINYCLQYSFINDGVSPVKLYQQLARKSPMPFSALYRVNDHYLVCASPERFLKKEGNNLISQPIKGTSRKGKDTLEDIKLKEELFYSEKERAENMMIVDLVRNDLARSCQTGSVKVEEMYGIHSFAYLHQMISTVTGKLHDKENFTSALRNAFPMGSMTGAPKIKVMELIEKYEKARRGIYSGSVGFINPQTDFDFNVVIRSLYGNLKNQQAAFSVGSAITSDSDPASEYEECLLKARAILEILNNSDQKI